MRDAARGWSCAVMAVFFALLTPLAAKAQAPAPAITVKTIEVRGNRRVDRSTIFFYISLKEGSSYTNVQLVKQTSKDVRTIYGLGFFRDVRVDVESFEGGLRVIYRVVEKPTISRIEIVGNNNVETDDIRERMTVKAQTIVNEATLKETVRNIRKLYQEKGYYFARVEAVLKEAPQNTVVVTVLIDEGDSVRIETITFRGNKSVRRKDLLSVMETDEKGLFSFITNSGVYREDELQKDMVRIRLLYESRGFFKAQIGQPIIREDRERGKLNITIPISEGSVYRIGEVEIRGGEDVVPPEELKSRMAIFEGDIFNRTLLIQDVQMISETFAERGYAFADVRPVTKADDEKKTVDLQIEVKKGRRVYIGLITVKGNSRTRENVIRREIRVAEGALYNAKGLARTRQRLRRTNYFETVRVLEKRRPGSDNILDLDVEVKEKPTGSITGGFGASSTEGGVLLAQIQEDNLFGRGYSVLAFARLSKRRQDFVTSFTDPDFRDLNFSVGGDLFWTTQNFDAFNSRRRGGRLRIGKEISDFMTASLGYELSTTRVTSVSPTTALTIVNQEGEDFLESILSPSLVYDSRDRRIFTRKGTLWRLLPSVAGGPLGGDSDFLSFEAEFRQYQSIGEKFRIRLLKELIFSYRANARYTDSFSGDFPAFRRLFMSGTHTLRGFRAQDIGPVDRNEEAIGGFSSLLLSAELTHPFIGPTQLALFIDAGNVWERHNAFELGDMRYGAGFGLRFITPVGPIRADIGYKLDRRGGERPREVHIGIGAAF